MNALLCLYYQVERKVHHHIDIGTYIIREPPPPCNAYDMMLIAKGGVGPITTIWVIELRNKCWNCLPFLKGLAYGNTSVPGQHDEGIWNTIETHESIFVHATFNKKWTDGACTIHFSVWGKEILNISIYRDKVLNNVMKFFHTVCKYVTIVRGGCQQ